jgi:hypothetical protein
VLGWFGSERCRADCTNKPYSLALDNFVLFHWRNVQTSPNSAAIRKRRVVSSTV